MKKFVAHPAPIAGIDQSKPPHLTEEGSCNVLANYNIRDGRVREIPGLDLKYNLGSSASDSGRVTTIVPDYTYNGIVAGVPYYYMISPTKVHYTSGTAWQHECYVLQPALFSLGGGGAPDITHAQCFIYGDISAASAITGGIRVKITAVDKFQLSINGGGVFSADQTIVAAGNLVGNVGVRFLATSGFTINNIWVFTVQSAPFTPLADPWGGSITKERATYTVHSSGIYISSLQYGPLVIRNRSNFPFQVSAADNYGIAPLPLTNTFPPGARYVEIFYEHLIVANLNDTLDTTAPYIPNYTPNRVRWSDVFAFGTFTPTITNEADLYDIETYSTPNNEQLALGITGLKRLRNRCMIYTQEDVYAMEYVGLPSVMQITKVVNGAGNFFRWGLAGNNNTHFYWSKNNCWSFDGTIPAPIGTQVAPLFFSLLGLGTANSYGQDLYSSTDELNSEVTWHFMGAGNNSLNFGCADYAITYNWKYQVWTLIAYYNPNNATTNATSPSAVSHATKIFPELRAVYGDICTSNNANPGRVNQTPCYETKDFGYETDLKFSEIESIFVDASFSNALGVSGYDIWYAFRDSLHVPVTYRYAGKYTGAELEKRFSKIRRKGRTFRFIFGNPYTIGAGIDGTQPVAVPYSAKTQSFGAQEFWAHGEDTVVETVGYPQKGAEL